jgi:hypothetical protein
MLGCSSGGNRSEPEKYVHLSDAWHTKQFAGHRGAWLIIPNLKPVMLLKNVTVLSQSPRMPGICGAQTIKAMMESRPWRSTLVALRQGLDVARSVLDLPHHKLYSSASGGIKGSRLPALCIVRHCPHASFVIQRLVEWLPSGRHSRHGTACTCSLRVRVSNRCDNRHVRHCAHNARGTHSVNRHDRSDTPVIRGAAIGHARPTTTPCRVLQGLAQAHCYEHIAV